MSSSEQFINELVHPLRVVPILSFEVGSCFTEKEKELLSNLTFKEISPGLPSISTSKHVLSAVEFNNLSASIQKYFYYYAQRIIGANLNFKITNSWVSKNTLGTSHHPHEHTNSMLSAVMYFDPSKKDGESLPGISFQTSGISLLFPTFNFYLEEKIVSDTPYNQHVYTIKPKNNKTVIIFPSHLKHSTQVNNTSSRFCLGINSFVTGKFGTVSNTNEINIQIS